jgi:hypothetical protein
MAGACIKNKHRCKRSIWENAAATGRVFITLSSSAHHQKTRETADAVSLGAVTSPTSQTALPIALEADNYKRDQLYMLGRWAILEKWAGSDMDAKCGGSRGRELCDVSVIASSQLLRTPLKRTRFIAAKIIAGTSGASARSKRAAARMFTVSDYHE